MKQTWHFTAPGDPVPYLRMTQGQVKLMRIPDQKMYPKGLRVKQRIRRYFEYKEYINLCVLSKHLKYDRSPKGKTILHTVIYFSNKKHGDPENIRKGIQDALFDQDRNVVGSVDFFYDSLNPRVEIEIIET